MLDTHEFIKTEAQLRRLIPDYPKLLDKRIQPALDKLAEEFIQLSRLAVLYVHHLDDKNQPSFVLLNPEQWQITSPKTIEVDITKAQTAKVSLLFLIPGVEHLLRINGHLHAEPPRPLTIEQVYFHCGRAAMRSELWHAVTQTPDTFQQFAEFIPHARYALLATANDEGVPLLSPRGEPEGLFQLLNENTLLIPERPGNKIAASLRNILSQPEVKLLMLIPGSAQVLEIHGTARLSTHPDWLNKTNADQKPARLALIIDINKCYLSTSTSLANPSLWAPEQQINPSRITPFSKALSSHINGTGIVGKMTYLVVDQVVKKDARNLY